jgi:hypothetical protein
MSSIIDTLTAAYDAEIDAAEEGRRMRAAATIRQQREALSSILQGWARTLSESDRITVTFAEGLPAPALLKNGREVFIDSGTFDTIDDLENVALSYGLVLHELGHYDYTPPSHDPLVRWVKDNGLWRVMNLLEDMRLETRLARRWPTVASWFDVGIAKIDFKDGGNQYTWLFLCGRETAALGLRKAALSLYKGDPKLPFALATEYTRLVPSRDVDRAKEIILAFAELMPTPEQGDGPGPDGGGDKVGDPGGRDEQPSPTSPKDEDAQEDEVQPPVEWTLPEPKPVVEADDEDEDDADGGDADGDDDSDEDADGGTSGDDDEDDEDEDGPTGDTPTTPDAKDDADDAGSETGDDDADDNGTPSNQKPVSQKDDTAIPEPPKEPEPTVADLVQEALDEAIEDVRQKLESDLDRIQDADLDTDVVATSSHKTLTVPGEFVALAASFEQELRVLRDIAAPGYDLRKRSGRLNTRRFITHRDNPRRVFDRFNPGSADAVSLHIDILVDQSTSMGCAEGQRACFMAWAIKRALDRMNTATSSIITYQSNGASEVAYGPNSRVPEGSTRDSYHGGNTFVVDALKQALRFSHRSNARYKAVFCLTDGDWYDTPTEELRRLHEKGVYTTLFYFPTNGARQIADPRGMQSLVNVTDLADVVNHVRNVVVEDIRRNIVVR